MFNHIKSFGMSSDKKQLELPGIKVVLNFRKKCSLLQLLKTPYDSTKANDSRIQSVLVTATRQLTISYLSVTRGMKF